MKRATKYPNVIEAVRYREHTFELIRKALREECLQLDPAETTDLLRQVSEELQAMGFENYTVQQLRRILRGNQPRNKNL